MKSSVSDLPAGFPQCEGLALPLSDGEGRGGKGGGREGGLSVYSGSHDVQEAIMLKSNIWLSLSMTCCIKRSFERCTATQLALLLGFFFKEKVYCRFKNKTSVHKCHPPSSPKCESGFKTHKHSHKETVQGVKSSRF